MGVLMYVNALRTLTNPIGFSKYMGLPVSEGTAVPWVRVYGLRALFIGLVVTYFLIRLDPASLQWIAAMAIPLALGDAWLVKMAGGKATSRHLIIATVLVVSTYAIHLWAAANGVQ
jgi:NADPH:quinone reductase-like Zn-dependent oxidoreductase